MEETNLKIGFYNPYFDGFGGGERYALTLASHWSKRHDVSIFWDNPTVLAESEKRFGLDLSRVKITPNVFRNGTLFQKLAASRAYDLIFFLSDGSIPLSFAKHNILHFQVPFARIDTNAFKRFHAVICNSLFTKMHLDPKVGKKALVIYPPVPKVIAPKVKKKSMILSVGRFTPVHTAKKQEIMIEAFKKLSLNKKDWELVLAGGLLRDDREYFARLVELSRGSNIRLVSNINYKALMTLYGEASMYWHAAGYNETDPMYMEHFGISTVEAMSAGAVPIVYADGGQVEIVADGRNGLLWKSPEELVDKTVALTEDKKLRAKLAASAKLRANDFSERVFFEAFDELLRHI